MSASEVTYHKPNPYAIHRGTIPLTIPTSSPLSHRKHTFAVKRQGESSVDEKSSSTNGTDEEEPTEPEMPPPRPKKVHSLPAPPDIVDLHAAHTFQCDMFVFTVLSWLLIIATLPFSLFACLKVVQEYESAVVFRLGRLYKGGLQGPGLIFVLPCIETKVVVDRRTVTFDVPPQEVLTKDSVTVSVDAAVYYRVFNPVQSVVNAENAQHSTHLLAQTTLRNTLGMKTLSEILSQRDIIAHAMQSLLDDATDRWGIKVERVEIKDVRLPVSLQRSMAAEAEATREAKAQQITAEGELKASEFLRKAADIVSSSPGALQLRYLQTLSSIANEKNSTIIFPMPVGGLAQLLGTMPSTPPPILQQPVAHHDSASSSRAGPTSRTPPLVAPRLTVSGVGAVGQQTLI